MPGNTPIPVRRGAHAQYPARARKACGQGRAIPVIQTTQSGFLFSRVSRCVCQSAPVRALIVPVCFRFCTGLAHLEHLECSAAVINRPHIQGRELRSAQRWGQILAQNSATLAYRHKTRLTLRLTLALTLTLTP